MIYLNGVEFLSSPTIQGTVDPGTGLTMPAFTAGGDITLGANAIKTTNLLIKELDSNYWALRNSVDNAYRSLYLYHIVVDSALIFNANVGEIRTKSDDASYVRIFAKDSGVGYAEIARLVGAADPYFAMGGSQEFKFYESGVATLGGDVTIVGTTAYPLIISSSNANTRIKLIGLSDAAGIELWNTTPTKLGGFFADIGASNLVSFYGHTGVGLEFVVNGAASAAIAISIAEDVTFSGSLILGANETVDGIDVSTHDVATTAVHGVGSGTITSVSTSNRSIYVDKEATGAADGTSWADAFTTIQAAVNDLEDVVIHAHTIHVRDGTKKTGTCDANVVNKIHDTGEFPAATTWAGRRVFNVDDGTWGVVSARDSDDQLSIVDIAGAALDLCPDGDEDYVIEPTPYRETVYLNGDPVNYPAHTILGSVTIRAEFYFYATCDANAVAGAIVDATYDFSDIEVGDRVFVIDLNGANGRNQDYELGTVDDVTNAATGTLGTTLAKTPTANWRYTIVKTEISGSDNGLNGGTARSYCFRDIGMSNVIITGFYPTFSNSYAASMESCGGIYFYGCIFENVDRGIMGLYQASVRVNYCYASATDRFPIAADYLSAVSFNYGVLDTASSTTAYILANSACNLWYSYIDNSAWGIFADRMSWVYLYRTTISANSNVGVYARRNSSVYLLQATNSGITPEDPAGTSEGAYIS